MSKKKKVYDRAKTVKSFLSSATEWHSFAIAFTMWILAATYFPGGRLVMVAIALFVLGGQYGIRYLREIGGTVVDPASIPDDIRKEPHYFVGGMIAAQFVLWLATLIL